MFFSFLSTIKVKPVDKMLKKNQLFMAYFTCLAEIKLLILSVFTLFLILDKIQDGG